MIKQLQQYCSISIVSLMLLTSCAAALPTIKPTLSFPSQEYQARYEQGKQYLEKGKFPEGEEKLIEAWNAASKQNPRNPELIPIGWDLAQLFREFRMFKPAENLYSDVLVLQEKLYGTQNLIYIRLLVDLGFVYTGQKRYKEAGKLYEHALKLAKQLPQDQQEAQAAVLLPYGDYYFYQGQFAQAEKYLTEALLLFSMQDNRSKEDKHFTLLRLGEIANSNKQFSQSMNYYNQALRLAPELETPIRKLALTNQEIGKAYFFRENYPQAKPYLEKSLSLYEKQESKTSISLLSVLQLYARTLAELQEFKAEKKYRQQTINIIIDYYGHNSPELIPEFLGYAYADYKTQEYQHGLQQSEEALQIAESTPKISKQDLLWCLQMQALHLSLLNQEGKLEKIKQRIQALQAEN